MLNKIKSSLHNFMIGRNGVDHLYIVSVGLLLVLSIIQLFVRDNIFNLLIMVFAVWILFRAFSKNLTARRKENALFVQATQKAKKRFNKTWRRIKDIRTYRYRQCPNCKVTLRLPKKRGKHTTTCPKCQESFQVTVRI